MFRGTKMGIVCLLLFVQCSNAELSNRIEELEKQVSLASEQREREFEPLQRQVSGLDTLLTQTKERVESVDVNRVEELEKIKQLEQLQQQVNGFDMLLVQTKEQVESVDANRIEELEKLEQLQRQVSGLDMLLAQTKERVESVDVDRVEALEKIKQLEQLQQQVNGLDTLLAQTGRRVEKLDKNLKNDIGNIRCLSIALEKFHHCLFTLIEEGEVDFDQLIIRDAGKDGEDSTKRGEDKGNSLLVTCGAVENVCTRITNLPRPGMPGFVGGSVASTDSESLGSKSFHP